MSNEYVISVLKENGFKITKQRKLIIQTILNCDGASCKEIYHKVISQDSSIGTATVYRMIRLLEDVGVLKHVDMILLTGNPRHAHNS